MPLEFKRSWNDEEVERFRDSWVRFVETEMAPHDAAARKRGHVGHELWRRAGELGFLCVDIPEEWGGAGGDFRYEAVLHEEMARRALSGMSIGVHSIAAHYLLNHRTEEPKRRHLPRLDEVRVPADNLLGGIEGQGFSQLMADLPYERMMIGVGALAAMEGAYRATLDYVRQRQAFGRRVADFQNTRFKLAEVATQIAVGRAFIDRCVEQLVEGALDAATAAMAKLWASEAEGRVIDELLQLHGGYGCMNEFMIARMYADARIARIYGGTNEIMKEVIARAL